MESRSSSVRSPEVPWRWLLGARRLFLTDGDTENGITSRYRDPERKWLSSRLRRRELLRIYPSRRP